MTREDKSDNILDRDSVSKAFASRYNEFAVANRLAGEAITAYRGCKINSNNETQILASTDKHFFGVPTSGANLAKGAEALYVTHGPSKIAAIGGRLEAQSRFKFAAAGQITRFVEASGARAILAATSGELGEMTDSDANDESITVVSDDTADSTQWVLIIGTLKTTGVGTYDIIKLDGTTDSAGTVLFDEVYAAAVIDEASLNGSLTAPAGTVTVTNTTSDTTLISLAAVTHMGLAGAGTITNNDCYDRRLYLTQSTLAADVVILIGIDYAGAIASEAVTFTVTTGIVKLETTNRFNRLLWIAHGGVADARTMAYGAGLGEDLFDGWTNNEHETTVDDAADQGADDAITVESDETTDITQTVYVAYKTAAGVYAVGSALLTGTTPAQVVAAGDTVLGAYVDAACDGAITVDYGTTAVLTWDAALYLSGGMLSTWGGNETYAGLDLDGGGGPVTVTCSNGSATDFVCVQGEDVAGAAQVEGLTLSSGAATTSGSWSKITNIYSSGTESTEHFRVHNGTDDLERLAKGIVISPSDADGDNIEVFIK